MDVVLAGFTDELIKLSSSQSQRSAEETRALQQLYREVKKEQKKPDKAGLASLRGEGRQVSRDYLASMLIGALAQPGAALLGGRISRALHNREVVRAVRKVRSPGRRREMLKHVQKGPLIGPTGFNTSPSKKPIMSVSELGGHAGRGAVMGSVIQMLRDRFSGSAGAND